MIPLFARVNVLCSNSCWFPDDAAAILRLTPYYSVDMVSTRVCYNGSVFSEKRMTSIVTKIPRIVPLRTLIKLSQKYIDEYHNPYAPWQLEKHRLRNTSC